MTILRTGVVGVGHLGYHHARLYSAMDDIELVGVIDADADRAKQVAADFGVPHFDTVQALVDAGAEAVSVATPTESHRDVALELLEAKVHVLVEKPIAADVAQGRDMVGAAAARGRILQVGHVERFNGAVVALMEAIKRPRFIECHRLSPYPNRSRDVSVVHDLMIHDIDIVLALDGTEPTSIDAIGVSVFSETEDIANVRIRFASGCVANLTASRVSMEQMRKIRIFEDNAYVSTDYSEQEVMVYRKKSGPLADGASPMEAITAEALTVAHDEPLRAELASFAQCIREGTRPLVSGEDGLRALGVVERIVTYIREHP